MNKGNVTENVLSGLQKWGKPGKNKYNTFIEMLSSEGRSEADKRYIAKTLFNNLLRLANEDKSTYVEMNYLLMRITGLRVNYHGEDVFVKPVIINNRMMLYRGKGKYIDAEHIFGKEVNLF